jgi:hypothetical protein
MRGPIPGSNGMLSCNYPKIKQGFIYDGDMDGIKKENQVFIINIEARCKCNLHHKYQDWMHKCEEEMKELERKKQEEREL